MAKSKRNLGYNLSGLLDLEAGTIVETINKGKETEEDLVYPFDDILRQFNGREITITIKETSELESV